MSSAPPPDDLTKLLHQRGQRATPQRLVILREIRRRAHHATAEQIGGAVREALPGTSIPTVYATLDLLVELGLARRIDAGAGPTLYDGSTKPHQHTVCRRCGRVDDLDGDLDTDALLSAAVRTGFAARSVEVVISGLCRDCVADERCG